MLCDRFCCLKQDGQDYQDVQDGAAREDDLKVWKTLMSIETAGITMLRSDRTLICAAAPRRSIAIKVLTDLFCLFRLRSIDMKVFQTFALSSCPS